jgi:hypothetical protein
MKLKSGTIYKLAEMVCGNTGSDPPTFPYRSLSGIERFFVNCDVEGFHVGSRHTVAKDVLSRTNAEPAARGALPSDGIIRIVQELIDPTEFARFKMDIGSALHELNDVLGREGLEAYLDGSNTCQLRAGDVTSAGMKPETPGFSKRELEIRAEWEAYLDNASEDLFTEKVLLPLLFHVGFQRISAAGHKDKALEYGKDIWMKFRLPTGHWIYFGVQVKKGRLDSSARTRADNENISEVLNQIKMALDTEVWDPDINKTVLVDHVYLVASGEITKAARKLLGEKLNRESRRHIIFMDREDVLNLAVKANLELPKAVDILF